jgi:phosphate acetyltransferase
MKPAANLYLAATESRSGKSAVALGVMEMLLRKIDRVGFFRPIVPTGLESGAEDRDITLIATHFTPGLSLEAMYGCTMEEVRDLITRGREEEVHERILRKYHRLREECDFVLCEGTDFAGSVSALEFDINAEISRNLGSPVLLVARAKGMGLEEVARSVELTIDSLEERGCTILGTIVNRADQVAGEEVVRRLAEGGRRGEGRMVFVIPEDLDLGSPTVAEVARALKAEVLYGGDRLHRHVHHFTVAAMELRNFLPRVGEGDLIITPGDRADVILACLAAVSSRSMETIAGIVLTGGLRPEEPVRRLIEGFPATVPILSAPLDTFPTARAVDGVHAMIAPDDERDITRALALFEENVDVVSLAERVVATETATVTPKMFEYGLVQRAREERQRIVLAEGEEERILRATETLLRRGVAAIVLLGNEASIRDRADRFGLQIAEAEIVDPLRSPFLEEFAQTYHEARRQKGVTAESARDVMVDVNYFGTMMIHLGQADGMVSGSVHSTAATIRPAFEFIKAKPGFSIVSSVFFMCLASRVLVYGDCAVNPDPTAEELSEIALSSAATAKCFGIEPVVAMLSYSTGESGKGEEVEKVRQAVAAAKRRAAESFPGLMIDGPLQYDAAVDPSVALTKMPGSEVAGRATVFIFPDLNTGNNTYKAVQRSAGAVAIGPVLQGLRRPVNDLSRGCTVTDIVNTVAITAIQAREEKKGG